MHEGQTCEQYERMESTKRRKAQQKVENEEAEELLSRISKPCPKCGRRLDKYEGCDHVTCKSSLSSNDVQRTVANEEDRLDLPARVLLGMLCSVPRPSWHQIGGKYGSRRDMPASYLKASRYFGRGITRGRRSTGGSCISGRRLRHSAGCLIFSAVVLASYPEQPMYTATGDMEGAE